MADHDLLDRRLRQALGEGTLPDGRQDAGAARDRMLAGLRRRRARRHQVLAGAAAAAVALAVALPLALAGAPAGRVASSSAGPGAAPSAGNGATRAPASSSHGSCRLTAAAPVACGAVSPGGGTGSTTAPAFAGAGTATGTRSGAAGALHLSPGTTAAVTLPAAPAGSRWGVPAATGQAATGAVATVRVGAAGGTSFEVRAERPGNALVQVGAEPASCAAAAGCPAVATWTLEVEVQKG